MPTCNTKWVIKGAMQILLHICQIHIQEKKLILIWTQLRDKLMYHFCNIYIYIYLNYVVNVLSRISIVMFICKTFIIKFVVPFVFSIKICGWKWNKFNVIFLWMLEREREREREKEFNVIFALYFLFFFREWFVL